MGFPISPASSGDLVVGEKGARRIEAGGAGPIGDASASRQVDADPAFANAAGWNCAVHQEYEGMPAVDWYVRPGTPVMTTMDGTATLFLNTYVNAFDYYGVDREPYIGDPDRARAPLSPFPGPGGGMGVYVSIMNDTYRTDYGHLLLEETTALVPAGAFVERFSRAYDFRAEFGVPRRFDVGDIVATWTVRRGDVIGFTGDAGYSEAPHLHYQIRRLADGRMLCPTGEAEFTDNGWLFR